MPTLFWPHSTLRSTKYSQKDWSKNEIFVLLQDLGPNTELVNHSEFWKYWGQRSCQKKIKFNNFKLESMQEAMGHDAGQKSWLNVQVELIGRGNWDSYGNWNTKW